MKLNDMKRKHNALLIQGQNLYASMLEKYDECVDLQRRIKAAEKEEYDPIPLMFGSGFYIDEADEHREEEPDQ
ncbi:MAG: hypothetical protein K9L88_12215 [Chromatiaceae bacterium]|nr:hypothetical protein [Chromatiaceae bacterium]